MLHDMNLFLSKLIAIIFFLNKIHLMRILTIFLMDYILLYFMISTQESMPRCLTRTKFLENEYKITYI